MLTRMYLRKGKRSLLIYYAMYHILFGLFRYYRSGLEMVRMANVYLEEGSLENAYVLYLKFVTLFVEKIRKHPEYTSVPEGIRATNSEKLREVFPKAEKLKLKLVEIYSKEYNQYLEQQVKDFSSFYFY